MNRHIGVLGRGCHWKMVYLEYELYIEGECCDEPREIFSDDGKSMGIA